MVIHQIFPKFAPRNQNVTDMKITTFNPDGSIKEVREHHFQIPKYITSFDPNHSFFDITDEDVAVVSYKGVDIEKDLLLNQYRFLIKFDYNNFLKQYSSESKIQDVAEARAHREVLSRYDEVLSSILSFYRAKKSVMDDTRLAQIREFESSSLWIDTIIYHAEKNQNRIPGKNLRNSLLSVIRRLYRAIRKSTLEGEPLLSPGVSIMTILYPFVDIQSSSIAKSSVIEDDNVLAKLISSLLCGDGKFRSSLYTIMHLIDSSANSALLFASGLPNRTISMVINEGNSECVTIPANSSNGVEIKKIELTKEEIVCIKCPHTNIGENVLAQLRDELKTEYNLFYSLNGDDVKETTLIEVLRHFQLEESVLLSKKNWKDFYFKSLDNLEMDYKRHYDKVMQLEVPYYYYYLLVKKCYPSKRYDFKDSFLEFLAYMAVQKKCIERFLLYTEMHRLNYMEEEAAIIEKESDNQDGNPQKDNMEALRDRLFHSNKSDIVKAILVNKNDELLANEIFVQSIMVFYSPLFDKKYVEDMSVTRFENLLKRIFNEENIFKQLRKTNCGLWFNLKLSLNIIGYLSKQNKDFRCNVGQPLIDNITTSLMTDLDYLWNKNLNDNCRKCITQFDYIFRKDKTNYTYCVFDRFIRKYVDDEYRRYLEDLKKQ